MPTQSLTFPNAEGQAIAARLDLPPDQHPRAYAVFAHCFTCTKNLSAVRFISRALNQAGFAVLRFDFTGLGDSDGEFADTNFTSNISDLAAAADFLSANYTAPKLLVGHSLGGAAVLVAARKIDSVEAVATIGAPFQPGHVTHMMEDSLEVLAEKGVAKVNIGGRPFEIKKQFVDDLKAAEQSEVLKKLRKPVLIMHSPQDTIVSIEEAAKIYHQAFHPKSFVSLDGADHLLSRKTDAVYAGQMIASWASRYLELPEKEELQAKETVAVRLNAADGYTTDIKARHHALVGDEPASVGGNDFGPSPYELVTAGLGACTAMTLHMYARRKKWPLESVEVNLEHYKEKRDGEKVDVFTRTISIKGPLDEEQRTRLLEIANRCPVHRTLEGEVVVETRLV
ncbi:MAG: alpha/beta fold hydrolase [Bacteroidota bacterium]